MTAPNQPAPPAPTPTMAEAIAEMEAHAIKHEGFAKFYRENDGLAHERLAVEEAHRAAMYRAALSAMRAVEAGPVAWALVSPDGKPHTLYFYNAHSYSSAEEVARFNRRKVDEVRALYAFPSPDGGSA